jgi:hypothetical protein
MNTDKNLPTDLIIVEPTAVEGKHLPVGHVIKNASTDLAMDLAGSGKARPATPELIALYNPKKTAAKPAEKPAEKKPEGENGATGGATGGNTGGTTGGTTGANE